jgi:hypothetical protein
MLDTFRVFTGGSIAGIMHEDGQCIARKARRILDYPRYYMSA